MAPTTFLESLPKPIIESIIRSLDTPELLQLCVSSKHLYSIVITRLYKKVWIHGPAAKTQGTISTLEKLRSSHHISQYTAVNYPNIHLFEASLLKHCSLASLIHVMYIEKGLEEQKLMNLITLTNLRECHSLDWHYFPRSIASNLRKICCPLPLYLVKACSLVDLKISYEDTPEYLCMFKILAEDIMQSGTHQNLKNLVIYASNTSRRNHRDSEDFPAWRTFFTVLSETDETLNLQSLGIEGPLYERSANRIRQVVNCSKLISLEIRTTGEDYKDEFDGVYTLVGNCLSLKNLWIDAGRGVTLLPEIVMNCLPQRLDTLFIQYSCEGYQASLDLKKAILIGQRNLKSLCLMENIEGDNMITEGEKLLVDSQKLYQRLYDQYISCMPHTSVFDITQPKSYEVSPGRLRSYLRSVSEGLSRDHIIQNAYEDLPLLTEYIIAGLRIDTRSQSVLVNGKNAPIPDAFCLYWGDSPDPTYLYS